jgi:hypothetical protein
MAKTSKTEKKISDGWRVRGPGSLALYRRGSLIGLALACRDGWNAYRADANKAHFLSGPYPSGSLAMEQVDRDRAYSK